MEQRIIEENAVRQHIYNILPHELLGDVLRIKIKVTVLLQFHALIKMA